MPGALNRAAARILKVQMEESSTTQRELARRTGIGQATISRMLNGKSGMTLDHFEALCRALRLSPADVISDASR